MAIPRNLANLANQLDTSGNPPKVQVGDSSVVVTDTGSNGTITFTTDNSERMRVTSAGDVGIGTNSPSYKLHVSGSGTITSAISSSSAGAVLRLSTSGGFDNVIQYLTTSNAGFAINDATAGANRMYINSSGQIGIGTSSPANTLVLYGATTPLLQLGNSTTTVGAGSGLQFYITGLDSTIYNQNGGYLRFGTSGAERGRFTSDGYLCLGKNDTDNTTNGVWFSGQAGGSNFQSFFCTTRADGGAAPIYVNRQSSDGSLIIFQQANTQEGDISVSGTTVSYNGGHLSRYAQTQTPKDDTLLKGTVLSNLDEMNVYTDAEGNPVPNEQLNKVKVSDVEGDVNVAGVFVNWSYDEQHNVDEINMAMTGDMIIRIAQGVVVQKGDLLMSAGDGTAKPQGDDIVRSKTIAKVTSNHVTCTYEDNSYCVPCVLMAC